MGNSSYDFTSRSARATNDGYFTKSVHDTFTQSKERKAHDSMNSKGITIREARDSVANPNTVPIICVLDLTGSMGSIPAHLVKDGLPTLMSNLIQRGTKDPALLFIGVGDHECDKYPLQVGQFESGDAELDMWLTRTYLEGGGGGNGGESYLLAWYFAAFHTATDAWDKRKEKGFLFTIGDEPNLTNLPASAIREVMGNTAEKSYTAAELLTLAQEKWNVFHIVVMHSQGAKDSVRKWKEVLGQHCIEVSDYSQVPNTIASLVVSNTEIPTKTNIPTPSGEPEQEIFL